MRPKMGGRTALNGRSDGRTTLKRVGKGNPKVCWGVLGRLEAILGPSTGGLGASWVVLGASWVPLGSSWGDLGLSWVPLGCLLGSLRCLLGASWGLMGGRSWGHVAIFVAKMLIVIDFPKENDDFQPSPWRPKPPDASVRRPGR